MSIAQRNRPTGVGSAPTQRGALRPRRTLLVAAVLAAAALTGCIRSAEERACRNARLLGDASDATIPQCVDALRAMEESCSEAYPEMLVCMREAETTAAYGLCAGPCVGEGLRDAFQRGLEGAFGGDE